MSAFQPEKYGPILAELLAEERLAPLGPGEPSLSAQARLQALTIEKAFAPHSVRDDKMAAGCLAGLWLYYDFLDESHHLSQEIHTPTGSYWHGLMHRREPDFDNSKYWFRRVGHHPVFEPLHAAVLELVGSGQLHASARFLLSQPEWDPFAFIDLCQACVNGQSPSGLLCRRIQLLEWRLLFDYCFQQAVGM
jgi:hypothetical protein